MPERLKLASWMNPATLAPIFRQHGRLHIPDILAPRDATRVFEAVSGPVPWSQSISINGRGHDARLDELARVPQATRDEVEAVVADTAREGFQYVFESWRLSDSMEAGRRHNGLLAAVEGVYDLLNSEAFLTFVRQLTGDPRPAYCDAQVTRYRAGHFLNTHDDQSDGKARLYAYVLSLTPMWKPDWGGLLLFHDADGHIAEGLTPRFNTLNIFRVPQVHSVSQVASFVTAPRLSITGWIRTAADKPS